MQLHEFNAFRREMYPVEPPGFDPMAWVEDTRPPIDIDDYISAIEPSKPFLTKRQKRRLRGKLRMGE
jgi:hypothetical protein